MYDFTKASDLVKWAEEQYKKPNRYKDSGIGRYDEDGTRQFDCCGLFKCFMWRDYHTKNAAYYNKTQKDLNCEGLIAEAKEKGTIDTIPEIPGVLVYQKQHMGIYIGNGVVIESTGAKYDGKNSKIYKTYFKGDGKGCDGKRTTWTHWFKSPNLVYETASNIKNEYTTGLYETLDNMRVRTGAGINFSQKRVKDLTKDGQKNATSSHPDSLAYYKKGTKFDVLEIIKKSDTEIWARGYSGYVNIVYDKYTNCKKIN